MTPSLKSLVIVGGGSAGWMTAAALSSLLDPKHVSITVVESDDIGTVGVGEATIPGILKFNALLGIDEAEFMKATQATFKLGIEFVDWGKIGEAYMHPFGAHGATMSGFDFHQYWLYCRQNGLPNPIDDYSICAVAGKAGTFSLPNANPRSVRSRISYAYHFDATLYARYLRSYAEARGVKRREGKIVEVIQAPDTGYITQLKLESGDMIDGELFFDCSGFRALLAAKTLNIPYVDWSHWLPCDTAQAVACTHDGTLTPYTRATARDAGWQWRIPTQHRTGNGHIYSSAFKSDDEAISQLVASLDGQMIGTPRRIAFTAGHRQTMWDKNCIAIGLSAGFLEPLESTSIYLIQEAITRFVSLFPDATLPEINRAEFNRQMRTKFEQVRDFIILHYFATTRDDSPFWNYCRTMSIPDSLQHKIDLFREGGRVFRYEEELFATTNWVAVFLGQNIIPKSCDPIVRPVPVASVMESLESMRVAIAREAAIMPTHQDFIKSYCPANPV